MQNWAIISPRISGSALAATAPDFKTTGRAIDGKSPQSARPDFAQDRRLGMRYVLLTDINRFYGSIYTHSIAWALHTKSTAKSNRTLSLLGNKIDYWVRMGQDQQTVGIPIGLRGHFKTGHTGSLQKRPTEGSRNLDVVLCRSLFGQV